VAAVVLVGPVAPGSGGVVPSWAGRPVRPAADGDGDGDGDGAGKAPAAKKRRGYFD
jgi:hypothetical protein